MPFSPISVPDPSWSCLFLSDISSLDLLLLSFSNKACLTFKIGRKYSLILCFGESFKRAIATNIILIKENETEAQENKMT